MSVEFGPGSHVLAEPGMPVSRESELEFRSCNLAVAEPGMPAACCGSESEFKSGS